jgi:hypothetical protein
MAEDKELTDKAQTGTSGKTTTTKKAATKKSTAKTAAKETGSSTAPTTGVDPNLIPAPAPEKSQTGDSTGTDPNPAPEATAAGDPNGADPSPEFRGKSPEDIAGKTTPKAPSEKSVDGAKDKSDPFVKLAKEYAHLYPKCKAFHITSDKQVFLEDKKNMADLHQRSLKSGQVTTVNID